MPRIHYRDYNPEDNAREIISNANRFLQDYADQGYTLTLRQLYYRFIANDLFPNTEKSYSRLGDIVARARDAGMIDWEHLEDRGRELESNPHWDNPQDFMDHVCPQYAIDLWEDQPRRVEVWVEKDALSQVIGMAAEPYDVPYLACKGYTSQSAMWEAGHKRFRYYGLRGQDVVVIHLGDHDPSGIDMTRDIEARLNRYSCLTEADADLYPGAGDPDGNPDWLEWVPGAAPSRPHEVRVEVRRIALNMDQIEQYSPPPNPAKVSDSRYQAYADAYGDQSWELDALDPTQLTELIQSHIEEIMDVDLYEARRDLQTQQRDQMRMVGHSWDEIAEFLGLGDE